MNWKLQYNIEYKGLKEGVHEFEFEVDNRFFDHFEDSLIDKGEIKIKVLLEKRSTFIQLHLKIKGWVELTCDRCLGLYQQKIKNKADLFVKFSENEKADADDVIWVHPDEHAINLAQAFYEYISLAIQLRHIHPKNKNGKRDCDPEMLKKIEAYNVKNSDEPNSSIDPRWEALKKLRNNN